MTAVYQRRNFKEIYKSFDEAVQSHEKDLLNLAPEYRFPPGCETLISILVIGGKVFSKGCIRKFDTQQPGGVLSKCAYRLPDNLTDEKMVLASSDLTTVEETTPDTVKTDMERIKPMGSIHVLLFQAQLELVERGRTGSQNEEDTWLLPRAAFSRPVATFDSILLCHGLGGYVGAYHLEYDGVRVA
ncbi:Ff.00g040690.m01.CDS01 [Fusarium sp. VM40]|nr:Ff.00g040690.m01.CDS01 [Fusarium sp. VM40]